MKMVVVKKTRLFLIFIIFFCSMPNQAHGVWLWDKVRSFFPFYKKVEVNPVPPQHKSSFFATMGVALISYWNSITGHFQGATEERITKVVNDADNELRQFVDKQKKPLESNVEKLNTTAGELEEKLLEQEKASKNLSKLLQTEEETSNKKLDELGEQVKSILQRVKEEEKAREVVIEQLKKASEGLEEVKQVAKKVQCKIKQLMGLKIVMELLGKDS